MFKRLQYHAKQIGTGILLSGLGVTAYLGFSSVFGKRSESDSRIEEINEDSLISLKNENQYPLTTQRIAEALSKSPLQSFDSVGQPKELTESKQISKLKKNNHDLDNLDNLQLTYRPKSKRAYPVTSEFQVNTYTAGGQEGPVVADLTDRGFVVVWQSNGQDGNGWGVYGQHYNATGNSIGSEFQVNTYTTGGQIGPDIAGLTNGGFVVVWQSDGQDGNGWGVYGQRYNATGNPIGSEFKVNTYTPSDQQFPAITGLTDGDFIVVWDSIGQDGDLSGIYGQRYNATGNPIGSEFLVNTYTTNSQRWPAITGLTDGGFVVVWPSWQDGNMYGVYGQRYNTTGNPIGSEFQVNTYTQGDQWYPAIAGLTDGGFAVVWHSDSNGQDGDSYGVYGQQYNTTGNPIDSEFQVNTYTIDNQSFPAIAGLTDGGFVVVWESSGQDGDNFGIYGQQYDAVGSPVGYEFQVNTYTTSAQMYPAIATLNDVRFVVVWKSNGQDGDSYGVYGRIFSSNVTTSTTTTTTIPITSISTTAALTTTMGLTTTTISQPTTSSSTNIPTTTALTTTSPLSTTTTTATATVLSTTPSLPITTTMPITSSTTSVPTTTQTLTTTTQTLTTATTQIPTTIQTSTTIHSGKDDNTAVIASSIVGAIVGVTAIASGITFFAVRKCKRQAYDLYTESIDLEERSASMSEREVIRSKQKVSGAELSGSYTEIPLFKNGQGQNVSSENDEQEVTLEQKQIKWNDIQLEQELGKGFFGTVHRALWQETKVAVKQLQQNVCDEKSLKEFKNEAKLMATLKHPNIVQFFGMGTRADNGNMFIVMEYMSWGSLYDYLHSEVKLSWEEVLKIAKHIAKGLNFLHNKKVLHRDLRSPNVLLNKNQAKIADFGLTRLTTKENIANTVNQAFGSPRWMASELFKVGQQQYTKKSDIYSYGIILWELVAQEEPFAEIENPMQIPVAVVQGMKNPIPDDCEPKYAELIKCCWNDNPANRPSAKDAIDKLQGIKTRRKSQIIEQQATSSKCFKELSSGYSESFQ